MFCSPWKTNLRKIRIRCFTLHAGKLLRMFVDTSSVLWLSHARREQELTLRALFIPGRECTRGGFCNFMHLKPISRELRRELYGRRRKRYGSPKAEMHIGEGRQNLLMIVVSCQASLSLTLPGTALTLQGPAEGSRETKVEGPRALRQILKEA